MQCSYSRALSCFCKDLCNWAAPADLSSSKQGGWLLHPYIKQSLDDSCPWGGNMSLVSSLWPPITGGLSINNTKPQQLEQWAPLSGRRGAG